MKTTDINNDLKGTNVRVILREILRPPPWSPSTIHTYVQPLWSLLFDHHSWWFIKTGDSRTLNCRVSDQALASSLGCLCVHFFEIPITADRPDRPYRSYVSVTWSGKKKKATHSGELSWRVNNSAGRERREAVASSGGRRVRASHHIHLARRGSLRLT